MSEQNDFIILYLDSVDTSDIIKIYLLLGSLWGNSNTNSIKNLFMFYSSLVNFYEVVYVDEIMKCRQLHLEYAPIITMYLTSVAVLLKVNMNI